MVTLGRVLFYDKSLSLNNSVSCASCHKQTSAFADNKALSVGFEDKLTLRNSMPIQDINISGFGFNSFFWDGREASLTSLVSQPILNHIEMGTIGMEELSEKLSKLPYYEDLFEKAFWGDDVISPTNISNAIAAFMSTINSENSKFEKHLSGRDTLSVLEQRGFELFAVKFACNECHQVQSTDGYKFAGTFANIGLDDVYEDSGVMEVSDQEEDNGKFKIPTLRNIALTAPYMHDGRFETLDEVLDFYSTGIQNNKNLDSRLQSTSGEAESKNITSEEKLAIIAFLNTLTDFEMLTNPELSNPFN